MLVLSVICVISACKEADSDGAGLTQNVAPLTLEEQAIREKRAQVLLDQARRIEPVARIDKLVDIAHVYHDTAAGPQAWNEMIFYLLDHSNNDPERAAKELRLFAKRCPNSPELMNAAKLQCHANLKVIEEQPKISDAKRRRELADEGLKLWIEVGLRLCQASEFANHYETHLETGDALLFDRQYQKAEVIWAKVESFKEVAKDDQRMALLLKRADLARLKGNDPKKARALYLQVRKFQDKLAEYVPQQFRDWVDNALKELDEKS